MNSLIVIELMTQKKKMNPFSWLALSNPTRPKINKKYRKHQLYGLHWMLFSVFNGNLCFLSLVSHLHISECIRHTMVHFNWFFGWWTNALQMERRIESLFMQCSSPSLINLSGSRPNAIQLDTIFFDPFININVISRIFCEQWVRFSAKRFKWTQKLCIQLIICYHWLESWKKALLPGDFCSCFLPHNAKCQFWRICSSCWVRTHYL